MRPAKHGIDLFQLGHEQQRNELVKEEEHRQAEDEVRDHCAVPNLFGGPLFRGNRRIVKRGGSRKIKRLEPELHGLEQGSDAAENGQFEDLVLLGKTRQRHLLGDDFARWLAHRNAIAVRRAHHDAFHDGLASDERLFAALEDGHQLRVRQ